MKEEGKKGRGRIKKSGLVRFTTVPIHTFSYYRKLVFLYLFFWYFFVREFISQSSATVFLMVCQLPTVRYSPRYRIHWIYEFICACNLVMRDSWIDEVHMSASWLCSLFLSHLLSLGSSDRSHNELRGSGRALSRWENPARAIPPRIMGGRLAVFCY